MDNYFRDMFESLTQTADGLIAANHALIAATEGVKKAAEAGLHAHEEHEDLRETVRRLEALIVELIRKQNGQQ